MAPVAMVATNLDHSAKGHAGHGNLLGFVPRLE
jgi:hypothetical protein